MSEAAPIAAIVTAYRRLPDTLRTLQRILDCQPPPHEVLVHVDANQTAIAEGIAASFPQAKVLVTRENIGPGGARNKLIAACKAPYVASFDDDSYPCDRDYFGRVVALFDRHPTAGVLAARVFHRTEEITDSSGLMPQWVDTFPGGGCAYRRDVFLATAGYVPLAVAYGMEEVDLSIRLIDCGTGILHTPSLRVFHDTDLSRHADPEVTAWSIANIALLAYLRYPGSYCWLGAAQLASRVLWLVKAGRLRGILRGLALIPRHLSAHRHYRATVSVAGLVRARELRRRPQPVVR